MKAPAGICPAILLCSQLLLSVAGYGQGLPQSPIASTPSWLQFSGKSRITSGSETPQPSTSGLPNDFARWEFEPTLSIYEVPIGARILLTTENDPSRSAMNSVSVIFDVKAFQKMLRDKIMAKATSVAGNFKAKAEEMKSKLSEPDIAADLGRYDSLKAMDSARALAGKAKEELEALRAKTAEARAMAATAERYSKMNPAQEAKEKEKELRTLAHDIADPNKLKDKLKEMDLFSGGEKALFGLKELGVGVTYPNYSPLVLTGVPINGATIDYSLGILNIGASGGSMGAPLPDGRTSSQTYKRTAYAGKLGLGSTDGTHLHFLGLCARDDETTVTADSAYSPAKNYVGAIDARLDLFNHGLSLRGSIAGSMFTRDVTAPTIDSGKFGNQTLSNIATKLGPNSSTSADYAWSVESEFNLFEGQTRGKVSAQMTGPGYMTLGVPYLRTDVLGREAELDQSLFSSQVTIGGYYRTNEDNILPWKRVQVGNDWLPARTTLTSYGGTFGLEIQDLPYLKLEYAPYVQESGIDSVDTTATNQTTLLSALAGYDYEMFGGTATTTLMALSQVGTSNSGSYAFVNQNFMLNQSVSLKSGLTLTIGANYMSLEIAKAITETKGVIASGTFALAKWWKGTLGLNFSDRTDGAQRLGFSIRSTMKVSASNDLELRAERNAYQGGGPLDAGYDQLRFRAVLSTKW
jgi:hypothetical protein